MAKKPAAQSAAPETPKAPTPEVATPPKAEKSTVTPSKRHADFMEVRVQHNGVLYEKGDAVELSPEDKELFISKGWIKA